MVEETGHNDDGGDAVVKCKVCSVVVADTKQ